MYTEIKKIYSSGLRGTLVFGGWGRKCLLCEYDYFAYSSASRGYKVKVTQRPIQ